MDDVRYVAKIALSTIPILALWLYLMLTHAFDDDDYIHGRDEAPADPIADNRGDALVAK